MIKTLFFGSVFLFFSVIKTEAQQWNLVWSDEFSGNTINTFNWSFETGTGSNGWGNNELQYYTNRAENATIYNDNLLIIGKKESYLGSSYTSARLKTQGKKSWTYGKIESRIKIPSGKGLWPAFWMLGNNITSVGWPSCGEIDIMEHVNSNSYVNGTMHWNNNGNQSSGGIFAPSNLKQYHVYSIEWDSLSIQWIVDGNLYFSGNIENNINSTDEFHKPFFLLLNLAIGGDWPGSPTGTTPFPDTMYVDYVRVYQKQTTTGINNNQSQENAIRVFPNPSNGFFTIEVDKAITIKTIIITDLLGREILKQTITNQSTIEINGLQKGNYILTLIDKEGYQTKQKIISAP